MFGATEKEALEPQKEKLVEAIEKINDFGITIQQQVYTDINKKSISVMLGKIWAKTPSWYTCKDAQTIAVFGKPLSSS